jgi:hypothetical protein
LKQKNLERHERDHALWKRIEEILTYRLETYRKQNDAQLDERQTDRLRGRIAELKDLLALGADPREDAID